MADRKIRVELEFGVNSEKAKKDMESLYDSLQKIQQAAVKPVPAGGISKQIREASSAASELQIHLERSFNANTGKLDLTKFSQSLKASGMTLQEYQAKLKALGPEGKAAFNKIATSIAMAEAPVFRLSDGLKKMSDSLINTVRWQFSTSVVQGFSSAIRKAYTYIEDLNESLNQIRIVTNLSTDALDSFAQKANKAAKALSTTTNEYVKASLIYFQQGLSEKEVEERTNLTIKMANVTGQTAQETSDQLTAIWNNFYDGTESLEHYIDVMTSLGAATASSSQEISEGLNKFAAVAETVGLSYEYAASALATVTATTRESANIVGNSFKTLFARIQGLQLGETLDDGTTLNKYSEALAKVGIDIKTTSGEIKDMDDILDEMGSKWETLGKAEQTALAQTVGGVRQYTQLIALMENWDVFKENLNTAMTSEGDLERQAQIYSESWEAARDRVTAALESIYQSLLDDKVFIGLFNFFETLLTSLDGFIDSIGGLGGVLTMLSPLLIQALSKPFLSAGTYLAGFTKKGRQEIEQLRAEAREGATEDYGHGPLGEEATEASKTTVDLTHKIQGSSERISELEHDILVTQQQKLEVLRDQVAAQHELAQAAQLETRGAEAEFRGALEDSRAKDEEISERMEDIRKTTTRATTLEEISAQMSPLRDGTIAGFDIDSPQAMERLIEIRGRLQTASTFVSKEDQDRVSDMLGSVSRLIEKLEELEKLKKMGASDEERKGIIGGAQTELENLQGQAGELDKEAQNARTVQQNAINAARDAVPTVETPTTTLFEELARELEEKARGIGNIRRADRAHTRQSQLYVFQNQKLHDGVDLTEEQKKMLRDRVAALHDKLTPIAFPEDPRIIPDEKKLKELDAQAKKAKKDIEAEKKRLEKEREATTKAQEQERAEKQAEVTAAAEKFAEAQKKQTNEIIKGKKTFHQYGEAVEETEDKLNRFSGGTHARIQAFSQLASTISTVAVGMTSLVSAFAVWGNQDLSFGEKFVSFLMSISSLFPVILSLMDEENRKRTRSSAITVLDTIARLGNAKAIKKQGDAAAEAAPKMSLLKKLSEKGIDIKGLWKGGLKFAAIAAAIAIIAITIGTAIDQYNAAEKNAEKMGKAATGAANSFEDAKSAYDKLKSSISDYESSVKSIEKLTKGTQEFRDAIQEANEKALDLISNYDLVADQDYTVDLTTGEIKIKDEALDRITNEASQKKLMAQNTKILADEAQDDAKLELEKTKIAREKMSTSGDQSVAENNITTAAGAGAAAGALIGWVIPVIGPLIGAAIGAGIGLIGGAIATEISGVSSEEEERLLNKLQEAVEEQGNNAFVANEDSLKEVMGNKDAQALIDALGGNIEAVYELSQEMVENSKQQEASSQLIASSILSQSEKVTSSSQAENLIGGSGDRYNAFYEQAMKNLEDEGWGKKDIYQINGANEEAKEVAKEYLETQNWEGEGWRLTDTTGNDDNREFVFKDNDNNTKNITLEEMRVAVAQKKAQEQLTKGTEELVKLFNQLSKSTDVLDSSLLKFMSTRDASEITEAEAEAIIGSDDSRRLKQTIADEEKLFLEGARSQVKSYSGEDNEALAKAMASNLAYDKEEGIETGLASLMTYTSNQFWDLVNNKGLSEEEAAQKIIEDNARNRGVVFSKDTIAENLYAKIIEANGLSNDEAGRTRASEIYKEQTGFTIEEEAERAAREIEEGEKLRTKIKYKLLSRHIDLDAEYFKDTTLGQITNFNNQVESLVGMTAKEYQGEIDGLMDAVGEGDRDALFNAIQKIDWTKYDAVETLRADLEAQGIQVKWTAEQWDNFANRMRKGSFALPTEQFKKLSENLEKVGDLIKDIKLGSVIKQEDYELLVAYNKELEKYFLRMANGDYMNIEEMNSDEIVFESVKALKENQDLYNEISKNGELKSGDIDIDDPQYIFEFLQKNPALAEKYGIKVVESISGGLFNADGRRVDFKQVAETIKEYFQAGEQGDYSNEAIGSIATDLSQLQQTFDIIGDDSEAYIMNLKRLALTYDDLADERAALKAAEESGNKTLIEQAQRQLEHKLAIEETQAAWEENSKSLEKYVKDLKGATSNKDLKVAGDNIRHIFGNIFGEENVDVFTDTWLKNNEILIENFVAGNRDAIDTVYSYYLSSLQGLGPQVMAAAGALVYDSMGYTTTSIDGLLNALIISASGSVDYVVSGLNEIGIQARNVSGMIEGLVDATGKAITIDIKDSTSFKNAFGFNTVFGTLYESLNKESESSKKKAEDEIERYHELKQQLEDINNELDNIGKTKDRVFGANKLALIDAEIAKTKELAKVEEAYLDALKKNLSTDRQAAWDAGVQTDESGRIINYEEIRKQWLDALNSNAIDEEEYSRLNKTLSQYEETLNEAETQQQVVIEKHNDLIDLSLEKVTYKFEIDIEIDDADLRWLEYQLEKLDEPLYDTAEKIANYGKRIEEWNSKSAAATKLIYDSLGQGVSEADMAAITGGDFSVLEKYSLTENQIDALKDGVDTLYEANEFFLAFPETVQTLLSEAFSATVEEMNKQTEAISSLSEELSHYQNIVNLVGKDTMKISDQIMSTLTEAITNNAIDQIEANKAVLEAEEQMREQYIQSYNEAIVSNDTEAQEVFKKLIEESDETIKEQSQNLRTSLENALEAVTTAFENNMEQIVKTLEKSVSGIAGSFEEMSAAYERQTTLNEQYLPDYEKIYRLSKQIRDVNESISKIDSVSARQELVEIQEEMNKLLQSEERVSNYTVEHLQKKYELKLAEIALEEAQNAKSQVRMQRDLEGNWSYVYTADEEKINKAQQDYEDKLFALQDLSQKYIQEVESKIVQLNEQMTSDLSKLDPKDPNYTEKANNIKAYYEGLMGIYSSELQLAIDNSADLYDKDWAEFSKRYGTKRSANEKWVSEFGETVLSQVTGFTTLSGYTNSWTDGVNTAISGMIVNWGTWKNSVSGAMSAAGLSVDQFSTVLEEKAKTIKEKSKEIKDDLKFEASINVSGFTNFVDKADEAFKAYKTKISGIITSNESLITSMNNVIKKAAEMASALIAAQSQSLSSGMAGGDGTYTFNDENPVPDSTIPPSFFVSGTYPLGLSGGFYTWSKEADYWRGIKPLTVSGKDIRQIIPILGTDFSKALLSDGAIRYLKNSEKGYLRAFDTGGYTGNWGSDGRLALLHQKELILNADDTVNFLGAVNIVRDIVKAIDLGAAAHKGIFALTNGSSIPAEKTLKVEQSVTIHADFPGVSNRNEIVEAFNNLVNRAAQFANR